MTVSFDSLNLDMLKKVRISFKDGCVFERELVVCNSFFKRFVGMLSQRTKDDKKAFLITKCNAIHTIFMAYPIDVIFLDKFVSVVDAKNVKPFRIFKAKHAFCALEGSKLLKSNNNIVLIEFMC